MLNKIILMLIALVALLSDSLSIENYYPVGGSKVEALSQTKIKWDNERIQSPVKIEMWDSMSKKYSIIGDNVLNSEFSYMFSDKLINKYVRLKITSMENLNQYYVTDSYFKVVENTNNSLHIENINTTVDIYPNPVLNSDYTISSKEKIQKIEIFDQLGNRIFYDDNIRLSQINTPYSFKNTGIYYFKIYTNSEIFVKKLYKVN